MVPRRHGPTCHDVPWSDVLCVGRLCARSVQVMREVEVLWSNFVPLKLEGTAEAARVSFSALPTLAVAFHLSIHRPACLLCSCATCARWVQVSVPCPCLLSFHGAFSDAEGRTVSLVLEYMNGGPGALSLSAFFECLDASSVVDALLETGPWFCPRRGRLCVCIR